MGHASSCRSSCQQPSWLSGVQHKATRWRKQLSLAQQLHASVWWGVPCICGRQPHLIPPARAPA